MLFKEIIQDHDNYGEILLLLSNNVLYDNLGMVVAYKVLGKNFVDARRKR